MEKKYVLVLCVCGVCVPFTFLQVACTFLQSENGHKKGEDLFLKLKL